MGSTTNCNDAELISVTIQRLNQDISQIRQDISNSQMERSSKLNSLESTLQDFKLHQVKLEERLNSIDASLVSIEKEFGQSKEFQRRVILSLLGGGITFLVYVIQHSFFN